MKRLRQTIVSVLRFPVISHVMTVFLTGIVFLRTALNRNCRVTGSFTVMQVGGRGGADPYTKWLRSRGHIRTVGVEPESSGLTHLRETKAYDYIVTQALSDKTGTAPLYITKAKGWCSLLEPDEEAIKRVVTERCMRTRPFHVVGTETVETTTIDAIANTLPAIDYLQIDVQGAELQVLRGAAGMLPEIAAIELEVRFYPLYKHEHIFKDIHAFLEEHGFLLLEMNRQGETEFGPVFAEANACYINTRIAERQSERMERLARYARAKHQLYADSFLRLLCDIRPAKRS